MHEYLLLSFFMKLVDPLALLVTRLPENHQLEILDRLGQNV